MTASLASMLRIERITWREIRLALKEPFRISSGRCTNGGSACSSSRRATA